jgi:hypothetical protein
MGCKGTHCQKLKLAILPSVLIPSQVNHIYGMSIYFHKTYYNIMVSLVTSSIALQPNFAVYTPISSTDCEITKTDKSRKVLYETVSYFQNIFFINLNPHIVLIFIICRHV